MHLDALISNPELFHSEIVAKTTSVLALLENNPSIALPFSTFLSLLPPMRLRQYSISSSPLQSPENCSITYAVINSPTAGSEYPHLGVASNYLASLRPGDNIQVAIRRTPKSTFRLPLNDASTPLLMFCAGTGIAPFRGFIQQRAVQAEANPFRKMAPALLFVGCRSKAADRLYADEIDSWVKRGIVDVRYAFSREREGGCKYVGDAIERDWADVVRIWKAEARVYICGSKRFADHVRETVRKLLSVHFGQKKDPETAEKLQDKFMEQTRERVGIDVFE